MTEIGGDRAVYVDPDDTTAAAPRIVQAMARTEGGGSAAVANASRFTTRNMIDGYARTYATLAGA